MLKLPSTKCIAIVEGEGRAKRSHPYRGTHQRSHLGETNFVRSNGQCQRCPVRDFGLIVRLG